MLTLVRSVTVCKGCAFVHQNIPVSPAGLCGMQTQGAGPSSTLLTQTGQSYEESSFSIRILENASPLSLSDILT